MEVHEAGNRQVFPQRTQHSNGSVEQQAKKTKGFVISQFIHGIKRPAVISQLRVLCVLFSGVCKSIQNPVTKARLFGFIEHRRWRPQPKAGQPAPQPAQAPPSAKQGHQAASLSSSSGRELSSDDRNLIPPPVKIPRTANP